MDKKGKIAFVIVMVVVAFLLGLSIFLTSKVLSYQQTFIKIAQMQEQLTQIKSGRNGVNGLDGANGRDGINATSYEKVETNTIVQQVPLMGTPGINGKDGTDGKDGKDGAPGQNGATQQTRLNPDSGDLETKYSNDEMWTVVIPCGKLLVVCPDVIVTVPNALQATELK